MAEAVLEQQNKRDFANVRNSAAQSKKEELASEAMEKAKQEAIKAAKKAVLRTINSAFAATIVGAIIAYIIMTFQFFAGNLMGNDSIALSRVELAIWAVSSILLLVLLVLVITILSFIANPVGIGSEAIKDAFSIN